MVLKPKLFLALVNAQRSASTFTDSVAALKARLAKYHQPDHFKYLIGKNPGIAKLQRAAVLVPIVFKCEKDASGNSIDRSYFILSQRTETIKTFKNEVCFVGGKCDEADKSETETAVREAQEEIGLDPKKLTLLAQISPITTTNGNLITPVLAHFDDEGFVPNLSHGEVAMVFELPTDRFLSTKDYYKKSAFNGKIEYYVHYFNDVVNGKDMCTWGLTGMLASVVSCLVHGREPDYPMDPDRRMKPDDMNDFLDWYLLDKSKLMIKMLIDKKFTNRLSE